MAKFGLLIAGIHCIGRELFKVTKINSGTLFSEHYVISIFSLVKAPKIQNIQIWILILILTQKGGFRNNLEQFDTKTFFLGRFLAEQRNSVTMATAPKQLETRSRKGIKFTSRLIRWCSHGNENKQIREIS